MLVTLQQILEIAQEKKFAVPAFNMYNVESVVGAVEAAEETKAPAILQVYPRLVKDGLAYYLAPSILAAARKASVPICFHLDHGPSELEVTRALYWGATGIMFDGSLCDYDENVSKTRRAVEICGHVGVGVEGELGHIGSTSDDRMGAYTEVEEAVRFVKDTEVTALAVLVGNAHGRYKRPPKLDIERIHDIYEATGRTPLVLHGGSGITDDQIRLAVKAGIRKMNFATDICYTFLDSVEEELKNPKRVVTLDLFMKKPTEAVKQFCMKKIELLGAKNKAG